MRDTSYGIYYEPLQAASRIYGGNKFIYVIYEKTVYNNIIAADPRIKLRMMNIVAPACRRQSSQFLLFRRRR